MKKIKLYVLIPDKASGDYFAKKLQKYNIETEYGYHKIHPRVINNKITTSKNVIEDMNNIFKTFKDKTRSVVIACNTLQLWLKNIDSIYKKNVKIYTTFEACEWKFKKLKQKPLWLGTTPLVEKTKKFPTLLNYKKEKTQNLVQELIWRIKMYYEDDIQTAFDYVKKDANLPKNIQLKKIYDLKKEIIEIIKKLDIKKVILGCTELPMFFKKKENNILWIDPAEILAEYVKYQSVLLLFAGGTISSSVQKDGSLIGGKVFDLLEKLSKNMPGSFKHLNISKSDIIYTGLSENTDYQLLNKIWNHIKEAIKLEPSRIVITHGTDAMEQTARYIEKKIEISKIKTKTKIVLTGSNLPPFKKNTDAWKNMRFAINAKIPKKYKNKVFIVFDNTIVPSNKAIKIFTEKKYMKYVSKDNKEYFNYLKIKQKRIKTLKNKLKKTLPKKINKKGIITYNVNKIRKNHNDLLKKIEKRKINVIFFKLYHSGTANTIDKKASVSDLIRKLTEKKIVCFGGTENDEPTNLKTYETSVKLLNSGLIPLYNMYFDIALFKIYHLNSQNQQTSKKQIIKNMLKNYAGEINEKLIIKKDINNIINRY